MFFRKHFNKKQLLSCHADPNDRTVNVEAYSGLQRGAKLFGICLKAAGGENQCHILSEVENSNSTEAVVQKINLFMENKL